MAHVIFSHPHVEDYIEIIAGHRDVSGNTLGLFNSSTPILSLARYDVNMVESLATQTRDGIGYTDRQAPLALNIVLKYERQLAKAHLSIEPLKTDPKYRLPIRQLDRSVRVWVVDDKIHMRFPFDSARIESIKASAKDSCGAIMFNRDQKVWQADLTEYNVNWAVMFARANGFEIDPSLQEVMDKIFAVESTNYAIELQAKDKLVISNAYSTLTDYIEENLGGFELDNVLKLVDYSPILGYTIDKLLTDIVTEAYGSRFHNLCVNKELRVDVNNPVQEQVSTIVEYARITNRLPIVLYEPDQSDRLTMTFLRHFSKEQVVNLDRNPEQLNLDGIEFVYTRKFPKTTMQRIPLMISSASMMFGGDRQLWIQQAEKIVYFTRDVYNKTNKKGREVCKLD